MLISLYYQNTEPFDSARAIVHKTSTTTTKKVIFYFEILDDTESCARASVSADTPCCNTRRFHSVHRPEVCTRFVDTLRVDLFDPDPAGFDYALRRL